MHVIRPLLVLFLWLNDKLILFQICESIAGLESDIPANMMARLMKYVVLKRRLQDLGDIEDSTRVSCNYISVQHVL